MKKLCDLCAFFAPFAVNLRKSSQKKPVKEAVPKTRSARTFGPVEQPYFPTAF
jgi:hypothetical protein